LINLIEYKHNRCLDYDLDWLLSEINTTIQENWMPTTKISQDESMAPHEGKNNPHHVHIKGKPHDNGIKLYSLADMFHYLYSIMIHKRTQFDKGKKHDPILLSNGKGKYHRGAPLPKKSVVDMVLEQAECLEPGHHLFGDSHYEGIDLVGKLVAKGHHATYSLPFR